MSKFFDDLKLYALKVLISLSKFIPDFILNLIFKISAKIWFLIDNERKLAVKNNLEIILGYSNNRLIYETFENYMLNFVDFLKSKYRDCEDILNYLKIENFELLERTYKIKNKLILLSAHIGSWEIALNFISCLGYKNMAIVESIDKRWLDTLNELRASKGTKLVLNNEIREIIKFLNNEGILCVVSDRYVGGNYLYCEIFNRKRRIPIGIFKLNEKFKIPLVFAYVIKQKSYYLGVVQDAYYEENLTFENMLNFYLKNLEIAIKKYPTCWFSFDFNWL
ncbi:MAG: lysophospholipid acyltransferase family protein [Candidatus Hydrothermia bacterium]|jgi:lauroyl/myristoyl acyltransferase